MSAHCALAIFALECTKLCEAFTLFQAPLAPHLGLLQTNATVTASSSWTSPAAPGMCWGQKTKELATQPLKSLLFVHIPRTGGTSIEDCTQAELNGEDRWGRHADGNNARHGDFHCNKQHVPPNLVPDYYTGTDTFCVVRNPYDRLVSQYGFMCGTHWGDWGKNGANVTLLNNKLLEALIVAKGYPPHMDCHFMPQTAYVYGWNNETNTTDKSTKHCTNILRYEDSLYQGFNNLMRQHGYTYLMQPDSGATAATRSNKRLVNITAEFLSDDVLRLANEIYADDFELFGYPMRSPSVEQADAIEMLTASSDDDDSI